MESKQWEECVGKGRKGSKQGEKKKRKTDREREIEERKKWEIFSAF